MKLLFTNEWLRRKIAADPDEDPGAGAPYGHAAMTAPPDDRETLAEWMRDRYATGHGDSVSDLLKELTWQIEERVSAAREEGRRQGAREMREAAERRAAHCLVAYAGIHDYESEERQIAKARRDIAGNIRALPLPGDPVSSTGQTAPAQGEPT